MAELKTKPNEQSVEAFLNSVEDEKKRQDCLSIINMKVAAKATGSWPDFLRASKT